MTAPKPSAGAGKGALTTKTAKQPVPGKRGDSRATRETVESIVIAVILAFIFRAFVAEAFVIPTGSMAPTLFGNHKDVQCVQCDHWYQAGASIENDDGAGARGFVVATTCPICRFTMPLDPQTDRNHVTFSGDRILVGKFSYHLTEPDRWDVMVFKYPGNAKQNYIKRLVGLPDETIRIRHGNIYVRQAGEPEYRIARKPAAKVKAMLQLVDDTDHIARDLARVQWPSRWQPWSPDGQPADPLWSHSGPGGPFVTDGTGERESWIRYRHLVPAPEDWRHVLEGRLPPGILQRQGQLITDYYAYNDYVQDRSLYAQRPAPGLHWVGDLAVEFEVEVQSDAGELIVNLVQGGVNYQCRIDVSDGRAVLLRDEGRQPFVADDGTTADRPQALTNVRGPGRYQVRMANVDDKVRLWVDEGLVEFDGPTTYRSDEDLRPVWSEQDPGDLAPVGVGSLGAALQVDRLQVLRDIYYIATRRFDLQEPNDYERYYDTQQIQAIFSDPTVWDTVELFAMRREEVFTMGPDEYFPLGDNSPQSKDARGWGEPPSVHRDLLTGKAVLIYWPHAWRTPVPFWPNFERMRRIR